MPTTRRPGIVTLPVAAATSLRESLEDSAAVAPEARGLLDRLALVLAEEDLSTVLALVSIHSRDPRELRQSLDRNLVP